MLAIAEDGRTGRRVVLKSARLGTTTIEREAEALAALEGPGVVRCVDVLARPAPTLVLERLRGPTLETRIRRGALDEEALAVLGRSLFSVLARLWRAGWVHGDVKPANIVLERGDLGRPVLVDLECATRIGSPFPARLTAPFAAPERVVGAPAALASSDVFSLGATLFACVRGASPFEGPTRDASLVRLLAHDPPSLDELSPRLAGLVARMLDKDPLRRPTEWTSAPDGGPLRRPTRGDRKGAPRDAAPRLPRSVVAFVSRASPGRRLTLAGSARGIGDVARFAQAKDRLLLHLGPSDEPHGSIAEALARAIDARDRATFPEIVAALRSRFGRLVTLERARHLAVLLGADPDPATRRAFEPLRLDGALLRDRRAAAITAALRALAREVGVVTVARGADARSLAALAAHESSFCVVVEEGAMSGAPGETASIDLFDAQRAPAAEGAEASEIDAVVRAAAAIGGPFDARDLAAATELAAETVERAFAIAAATGRFELEGAPGRARLANHARDPLANAPAEEVRTIRSRVASLRAARPLEDQGGVARLFAEAGEPLRAAYHAWRGAERAFEAADHARASALLSSAESALSASRGPVTSLLSALTSVTRARLGRWTGDFDGALLASRRALAALPSSSASYCDALAERALVAGKRSDVTELFAVASALREPPAEDAELAWDRAASRAATQLYYLGAGEAADAIVALFLERTTLASGRADERRRGLSPAALVTAALFHGRLDEYLARLSAAVRAFHALGDLRSEHLYGSAVGFALCQLGQHRRAVEVVERVRARAARSGIVALVAAADHNLGEALSHLPGRLAEAIDVEGRAVEALRRDGDRRLLAGSLAYRSRMFQATGALDLAEADARGAVELGGSITPLVPLVFGTLALVEIARGRSEAALSAAERARAAAAAGVPIEAGEALSFLALAEAHRALGRRHETVSIARRALEEIDRKASLLRDRRLRKSFLERVPEHRRLRALGEVSS